MMIRDKILSLFGENFEFKAKEFGLYPAEQWFPKRSSWKAAQSMGRKYLLFMLL